MNHKKTILLIEDDDNDVLFTKRAIKDCVHPIDLLTVNNGKDALDLMNNLGEYSEKRPPHIDLILLDINIPKINGLEVLRQLRSNETERTLPIVVFSSSKNQKDIVYAGEYGANSYVKKPSTYKQFNTIIKNIVSYWFDVDKYHSS